MTVTTLYRLCVLCRKASTLGLLCDDCRRDVETYRAALETKKKGNNILDSPAAVGDDSGNEDDPDGLRIVRSPGLSFMSGLPATFRRRRVLVPTQVWVDDSGTKGTGAMFVFASISMTAERWADFATKWSECLATPPTIRVFKWSAAHAMPTARLQSFVRVINDYPIRLLPVVVDLNDFEGTVAHEFPKPLNHPYFWAFNALVLAVANDLRHEAGTRDQFELIFDRQLIFEPRVRLWYPFTRILASEGRPDIAPLLPEEPLFRDDEHFMPLQAADLFSGLVRAYMSDDLPESLQWVRNEIRVAWSKSRVAVDKAALQQFVALAKGPALSGKLQRLSAEFFEDPGPERLSHRVGPPSPPLLAPGALVVGGHGGVAALEGEAVSFRDNQDSRGWCGACYRLEAFSEHAGCCCVCHGPEGLARANRDRSRQWATILAGEIERAGRVMRKAMGVQ
jgi:hypothetical protein